MNIDLSLAALFTSRKYAITGQFDGVDLVNGGKHEATDVGNFGMNDPIKAPFDGPARGLYHFDGAIGIEYDLGDGWRLELWHLNATLGPLAMVRGRSEAAPWQAVKRGQVCGRTGNTGALVNGRPMPAHTHIRLERNGAPVDAEPYLLGRPMQIGAVDDMRYPRPMKPLALVTIAAGNNLRRSPHLKAEALLLTKDAQVGVCAVVTGEAWADKGTDWLWVGFEREMWCVHSALAPGITVTGELGLSSGAPGPDVALLGEHLRVVSHHIAEANRFNAAATDVLAKR